MTGRYGALADSEREAAAEVLAYAFPDEAAFAERARNAPAEWTFAVRDEGRLISVVLWQVASVAHHGIELAMCLAGPGATHPRARRRGALAAAQPAFLAAMREAGCAVSGLETPIARWHRRNGWDVASAVRRYSAPAGAFRPLFGGPAFGEPSYEPNEHAVAVFRRATADRRFGALQPRRQSAEDHADLRTDTVVWQEDDKATGLLHYSHRRDPVLDRMTIVVHELLGATSSAYAGLLGLLAEHNNVSRVVWNAPVDDPLHQLVAEPREVEPVVVPDKMIRVVDLARVTVPRLSVDSASEITVEVYDSQAPWNSGVWCLVADGDVHRFVRTSSAQVDLRAEVDILGPVLTGHLTAAAAAMTGRLRGEESALRRLDRARLGWSAPHCPETW